MNHSSALTNAVSLPQQMEYAGYIGLDVHKAKGTLLLHCGRYPAPYWGENLMRVRAEVEAVAEH